MHQELRREKHMHKFTISEFGVVPKASLLGRVVTKYSQSPKKKVNPRKSPSSKIEKQQKSEEIRKAKLNLKIIKNVYQSRELSLRQSSSKKEFSSDPSVVFNLKNKK